MLSTIDSINNITAEATTTHHDINQTHNHNQMIQTQQQKVHQLPPLSEDPRTLQLALELSLVGLNESGLNPNGYVQPIQTQADLNYDLGSVNLVSAAYARSEMSINNLTASTSGNGCGSGSGSGSGLLMPSAGLEDRSKKSQNMTECVPVPSSEHVAEIVGRQGKPIN